MFAQDERKKFVICDHLKLCSDDFSCFLENSCRIPVGDFAEYLGNAVVLSKPESMHGHQTYLTEAQLIGSSLTLGYAMGCFGGGEWVVVVGGGGGGGRGRCPVMKDWCMGV